MKILTDMHIHTNVTPDAYSTLHEYITFAKQKNLELLAVTNHSPICFETKEHAFSNAVVWPREIDGITVIRGIEADIVNSNGDLDISETIFPFIEFVIASCHRVFQPSSEDEFKTTFEKVIKNPKADVLGHICRIPHLSHLDYLLPLAKQHNKPIELNAASFNGLINPEWAKSCRHLMLKCKEHNAPICVNTDAHICYSLGEFTEVENFLAAINFPESLIMNRNKQTVMAYLSSKSPN